MLGASHIPSVPLPLAISPVVSMKIGFIWDWFFFEIVLTFVNSMLIPLQSLSVKLFTRTILSSSMATGWRHQQSSWSDLSFLSLGLIPTLIKHWKLYQHSITYWNRKQCKWGRKLKNETSGKLLPIGRLNSMRFLGSVKTVHILFVSQADAFPTFSSGKRCGILRFQFCMGKGMEQRNTELSLTLSGCWNHTVQQYLCIGISG